MNGGNGRQADLPSLMPLIMRFRTGHDALRFAEAQMKEALERAVAGFDFPDGVNEVREQRGRFYAHKGRDDMYVWLPVSVSASGRRFTVAIGVSWGIMGANQPVATAELSRDGSKWDVLLPGEPYPTFQHTRRHVYLRLAADSALEIALREVLREILRLATANYEWLDR